MDRLACLYAKHFYVCRKNYSHHISWLKVDPLCFTNLDLCDGYFYARSIALNMQMGKSNQPLIFSCSSRHVSFYYHVPSEGPSNAVIHPNLAQSFQVKKIFDETSKLDPFQFLIVFTNGKCMRAIFFKKTWNLNITYIKLILWTFRWKHTDKKLQFKLRKNQNSRTFLPKSIFGRVFAMFIHNF